MTWTRPVLLTLLTALLVLTLNYEAESAAVRDDAADKEAGDPQGAAKRIFMPEADAANFFKRRSRRSMKSQAEINEATQRAQVISTGVYVVRYEKAREVRGLEKPKATEQRQRLSADERRREYYEEQRDEYENYVEEERDEQNERTRQKTEQWREFHYDGLYPSYPYNRHHV